RLVGVRDDRLDLAGELDRASMVKGAVDAYVGDPARGGHDDLDGVVGGVHRDDMRRHRFVQLPLQLIDVPVTIHRLIDPRLVDFAGHAQAPYRASGRRRRDQTVPNVVSLPLRRNTALWITTDWAVHSGPAAGYA